MAFDAQQLDLRQLADKGRLRELRRAGGVDFASNDYLALAGSSRLGDAIVRAVKAGVPAGSGGSRLLRGNHPAIEQLERQAASFFGVEAALFFGSGYAANTALFAALPQRGDLIVHDELVHASAHDGLRLSRAQGVGVRHNDPQAFADAIMAWRNGGGTGAPWIAVESLYSMDGDRAPLHDLAEVADRHGAILLIDEAHAVGVWGRDGRGLADGLDGRPNVVTLKTCGKALGCEGALICGPGIVRDFLIARARGFIFSTAPSPLVAVAVGESLSVLREEPERRERLRALIGVAAEHLAGLGVTHTGTQIMPLVICDDGQAMRVAAAVQAAGFDVRGIRPPTVPVGTARLRISLTLNVNEEQVAALGNALREALA